MSNKNKEYTEKYAEYAMEQMRKYGIPASITLAQGILESANGQSQLARNENNHFGIKASSSWLASGGAYGLYTDDKPNEKFCSYNSVAESYEHHSRFLKENRRYAECFRQSPDNYKAWAQELDKAGYATAGKYAPALISIIERNDLTKYDRMVMEEMRTQGKETGTARGVVSEPYSFPLKRDEFLFVTSPFGNRQDPMNKGRQQFHKGIDIRTDHEPLLATENNGKVVAVNSNANSPGGKSVTVEYAHEDGCKVQVMYCHLDSVDVKAGDTVYAGLKVGVSGNTGSRTTGPHLHMGVKQISSDGTRRDIDPATYLSDIAVKGNIKLQLMHNGEDLLAKYHVPDLVQQEDAVKDETLSPDDWMKKLLSSEDSGVNLHGGDPIMDMIVTMFSSLMVLANQIDNKEEKMQAATDAALNRQIDLSTFIRGMKECSLKIQEDGGTVLHINDGSHEYDHRLSNSEMNRLSLVLSNTTLDDDAKRERIGAVISQIAVASSASLNYEQVVDEGRSHQENMQIK